MIEVLFADSESASMKEAKKKIAGKKWMDGKPSEVLCLCYMLDIGDIKKEITSQYRKNLIYSMYHQRQWCNENQGNAEYDKELLGGIDDIDIYMQELKRLKTYLEAGESIRIWYSNAPYSQCGLYYVCHVLCHVWHKYQDKVHVVRLPEYVVKERLTFSYQNWGEVAPEEFIEFLPDEKKLLQNEVNGYAILWSELVTDRSPLRAMVNGKIVGVPEDFYDSFIFKKISKNPTTECRVIGDILGCYPIGIWDWWYAKRIQHYIEKGIIKVVEDSERLYARKICLR